jgi:proteic killer suppression protein
VIKSFRPAGLALFYETGSKRGINHSHANKLSEQLFTLNRARKPGDMDLPGWKLHPLRGSLSDHWSVKVNGNWRMTFRFEDENAILIDYQDYH